MKNKKKIIIILTAFVVIAVIGIEIATSIAYDSFFTRADEDSFEEFNFHPANATYSDLEKVQYKFTSDKGQTLVGYNYYKTKTPKALIVFVHGLGGGHNYYKPLINSLTNRGYSVFAFDGTGNGESGGDSQVGFEQHIIDLEYALGFIRQQDDLKNLKVSLVGHSWGGYAVSAVLNSSVDIRSVVAISGFSNPYDLELDYIREGIGGIGNIAYPFLAVIKTTKFDKYANYTGLDGFKNSDTPGLIIASSDDEVVEPKYGYEIYQNNLPDDRLEYILYNNRGHNPYYSDAACQEYSNFLNEMRGLKLPDDSSAAANILNNKFSLDFWQTAIDEDLITKIDEFIMRSS